MIKFNKIGEFLVFPPLTILQTITQETTNVRRDL